MTKDLQIVLQIHEGLHRMRYFFIGPDNSRGTFYQHVVKAFKGVKVCTITHNNLLIIAENVAKQNKNFLT